MAQFGSSIVEFPGAGPLGVLTLAFVAGFRWKREDWTENGGVGYLTVHVYEYTFPEC